VFRTYKIILTYFKCFYAQCLFVKDYNFWGVIISVKLNQMKHMTPSSCNPCQKLFNAMWIFYNQTWFGFQIALWMVGSLFANNIKNYIYVYIYSWRNTTFLLKSLRSSKKYKLIKLKHVSTLQTLIQIRKNQQATNYLNFCTTYEINLIFFFKHSIFLKILKIFKHVHKTIWNLWNHLKSQQSRFNEMNKMKCDIAMIWILN
jgi:hypothetical protein